MSVDISNEREERRYQQPYTSRNPIPTVQQYREVKDERERQAQTIGDYDEHGKIGKVTYQEGEEGEQKDDDGDDDDDEENLNDKPEGKADRSDEEGVIEETSESLGRPADAKKARKSFKKKGSGAERTVTDPVTHLPIRVHDFTQEDLEHAGDEKAAQDLDYIYAKTHAAQSGNDEETQIKNDALTGQRVHREFERLYPQPELHAIQKQLSRVHSVSLGAVLIAILFFLVLPLIIFEDLMAAVRFHRMNSVDSPDKSRTFGAYGLAIVSILITSLSLFMIHGWNSKKVSDIWHSSVWESERQQGRRLGKSSSPESSHWLNALMGSIWPLMNPELFNSVADTLEDVMQASLPALVRMISVEDIGQGSESLRVLGVRWLPKGAASQNVTKDGKLQKEDKTTKRETQDNTSSPNSSTSEAKAEEDKKTEENGATVSSSMQAEDGDFLNLELTISFRSRLSHHGLRTRSKNPHIYLAFYLPGRIKLPVFVELRGLLATLRLRLNLCPDPPFVSNATLTFLGQPKVDISCTPLLKRGLDIMDLPIISSFVRSAVDAAVSQYVAPRSLSLDLKSMLVGDDFKHNTTAKGILVAKIHKAVGFKEGDSGWFSSGSTDAYISVGWAKMGKALWSTRVIPKDMEPVWEEVAYVLVTEQELAVGERVRVQLWDSDRFTADDDLGRIEVDLQDILNHGKKDQNGFWKREDGFRALKAGDAMPGRLIWEIGWFSKTGLLDEQLRANKDKEIEAETVEEFRDKIYKKSAAKLREASKDESAQIEKQRKQDLQEKEDLAIIAVAPPNAYPSGILSIVIHQIQGLELAPLNKRETDKKDTEADEIDDENSDLPSSYCTIILNHSKVFKTRTKPHNPHPFFNAGTERFVADISKAHVHIAVRDARVHEDDSLIGVVDLPMAEVFKERSQINNFWPLSGGCGYGQVRISMVFRSVQMQVPRSMLGWDCGTLELNTKITGTVDSDLQGCKIKASTRLGAKKFYSNEEGKWEAKDEKNTGKVFLGVWKRYASCTMFEFRASGKIKAFAVLWLRNIEDEMEKDIKLTIWKGDAERARNNGAEEFGQKAGELQVKLNFWPGLSGYHVSLAKGDANVEDIMDILDCANDEGGDEVLIEEDSSSDEEDSRKLQDDGKRTLSDEVKEYKSNRKQLHRRNRGLMQWKAPRTLKWMGRKIDHAEDRIANMFSHNSGSTVVETEV